MKRVDEDVVSDADKANAQMAVGEEATCTGMRLRHEA